MARKSANQNAFTGGELSILLLGRQDFAEYYDKGLFVCLNGLPLVQGPWTRRPGTAFLHQTKFNSKESRLFPFQYSTTQTYVLEFGNLYIRFFTGHGILVNTSQSITSITQAATGVVTKNAHGYANGDRLHLSSIIGMTQLNNREVVVTNKAANTFELYDTDGVAIATTGYGAFTSGNMAKIFEVVSPWTEAQLSEIRITQSADTLFITHPDTPQYTLVRISALSWSLARTVFTDGPYDNVNATTNTLTPSAATTASTAVTGYANNGSGLIRITAIAHGLVGVNVVVVRGITSTPGSGLVINGTWTATTIDADHVDLASSVYISTTIAGGFLDGPLTTLTAASRAGINGDTGFASTDVGRLIRIKEGTTWGYCEIINWISSTVVGVDVLSTLTNTNAKTAWRMGIWSATTGYPTCSTFHEDRLYFGGTAVYPQRLDGSNVSQYTNFSPSANDGTVSSSNAVAFTLNSDDVNAILWLSSHDKGLLAGTTRGEWRIRGTNIDDAITPTNISAKAQTRRGSFSTAPVIAGESLLFIQRGGRKVREMAHVALLDRFKAPDMTSVAEHITAPGISQIVYQEQPQPIVWAVRDDGALLGMTYDRDSSVVAWHRHLLGGDGIVESLAVVVDPTETRDELYLVVKRTINGGTKRYVEYMSKIWENGVDVQEDAFQVDCGTTDLTAGTTITGLWYLEGQTVGAYVDGKAHADITISNGTATFDITGTIKTIGYFYSSDGQTMPIEGGSQDGTAQGKIKILKRIGFWLVDTLGLKYGPDADHLTELLERDWGAQYGVATALATGVRKVRFEGSYDRLGQVYWRASGPFSATVCALLPQFDVSDDT